MIIRLTLWSRDSMTTGPSVYVVSDKITSIASSFADAADGHIGSLIYLLDGRYIRVYESPDWIVEYFNMQKAV